LVGLKLIPPFFARLLRGLAKIFSEANGLSLFIFALAPPAHTRATITNSLNSY
jgi:hypothetical protein